MVIPLAPAWDKLGLYATKIVRLPPHSPPHPKLTRYQQNDRLSVHFFSVASPGFMSLAGIPAFLEERHVFLRECFNGLYTRLPYVIANSVVGRPSFPRARAMLFSVVR